MGERKIHGESSQTVVYKGKARTKLFVCIGVNRKLGDKERNMCFMTTEQQKYVSLRDVGRRTMGCKAVGLLIAIAKMKESTLRKIEALAPLYSYKR